MKQLPVATKRSARMCVALPEIAANDVRLARLSAPRRQRPVFENLHRYTWVETYAQAAPGSFVTTSQLAGIC
jgi:hypothetical protein